MAEVIQCPSCHKKLRLPENLIGKNVKCPACSTMFVTEVGEEDPPTAPVIEERPPSSSQRRRPQAPPPEEDDYEEEPFVAQEIIAEERGVPQRRQGGLSRCPYCESTFPPLLKKKIAPAG